MKTERNSTTSSRKATTPNPTYSASCSVSDESLDSDTTNVPLRIDGSSARRQVGVFDLPTKTTEIKIDSAVWFRMLVNQLSTVTGRTALYTSHKIRKNQGVRPELRLTPEAGHVEQFVGCDADVLQRDGARCGVVQQPALHLLREDMVKQRWVRVSCLVRLTRKNIHHWSQSLGMGESQNLYGAHTCEQQA